MEINCYIDKKNEIWFRGKEIALLLGYNDTKRAIQKHIHEDDKKLIDFKIEILQKNKTHAKSHETRGDSESPRAKSLEKTFKCFFINESGLYTLILGSMKPSAREFKHWVTSKVLPSIRKKGYYDIKSNKLVIESESDLHYKVVDFIRNKYPEALTIVGLGEYQTTPGLRISCWKKGYMAGQCDLMIVNPTSKYNSLCIEFKSPTGSYQLSDKQLKMKEMYVKNKCKYLMSNSYDDIIFEVIKHLEESDRYLKHKPYKQKNI